MQFAILVHVDPQKMAGMTDAERAALDRENLAYDGGLAESGRLIAGGPLDEPDKATVIRNVDGRLSMTDGPYVETKEHLGGILLIEAADREEAIRLASDTSMARYGAIEVRRHWSLEDYLER